MRNLKLILHLRNEAVGELAEALGVHRDTVYDWMSGRTDPHRTQKELLAEHLCVSFRLLDEPRLGPAIWRALRLVDEECRGDLS